MEKRAKSNLPGAIGFSAKFHSAGNFMSAPLIATCEYLKRPSTAITVSHRFCTVLRPLPNYFPASLIIPTCDQAKSLRPVATGSSLRIQLLYVYTSVISNPRVLKNIRTNLSL